MRVVCPRARNFTRGFGVGLPGAPIKREPAVRIRCLLVHADGPAPNLPGNKRDLSTGETGEFAPKNSGFDLNLGGYVRGPQNLSSNLRERLDSPAESSASSQPASRRCCQQKGQLWVRSETVWLPTLDTFRTYLAEGGYDRTRECPGIPTNLAPGHYGHPRWRPSQDASRTAAPDPSISLRSEGMTPL